MAPLRTAGNRLFPGVAQTPGTPQPDRAPACGNRARGQTFPLCPLSRAAPDTDPGAGDACAFSALARLLVAHAREPDPRAVRPVYRLVHRRTPCAHAYTARASAGGGR